MTKRGDSKLQGTGLFATREIRKGQYFIEYTGERIENQEFKKRVIEYSKGKDLNYIIEIKRDDHDKRPKIFIDAQRYGNDARFANHSCSPNSIYATIVDHEGLLRIFLMAKLDIHPGEEITINYGDEYKEHKYDI